MDPAFLYQPPAFMHRRSSNGRHSSIGHHSHRLHPYSDADHRPKRKIRLSIQQKLTVTDVVTDEAKGKPADWQKRLMDVAAVFRKTRARSLRRNYDPQAADERRQRNFDMILNMAANNDSSSSSSHSEASAHDLEEPRRSDSVLDNRSSSRNIVFQEKSQTVDFDVGDDDSDEEDAVPLAERSGPRIEEIDDSDQEDEEDEDEDDDDADGDQEDSVPLAERSGLQIRELDNDQEDEEEEEEEEEEEDDDDDDDEEEDNGEKDAEPLAEKSGLRIREINDNDQEDEQEEEEEEEEEDADSDEKDAVPLAERSGLRIREINDNDQEDEEEEEDDDESDTPANEDLIDDLSRCTDFAPEMGGSDIESDEAEDQMSTEVAAMEVDVPVEQVSTSRRISGSSRRISGSNRRPREPKEKENWVPDPELKHLLEQTVVQENEAPRRYPKRRRVQPMEYWRNQRIKYGRDSTGTCFKVVGIDDGFPGYDARRKTKKKGTSAGSSSRRHRTDGTMTARRVDVMNLSIHANLDPETMRSNKYAKKLQKDKQLLASLKDVNFNPSSVSPDVEIALTHKVGNFSRGMLKLKPFATKTRQQTVVPTTIFSVVHGVVGFVVDDNQPVILKTGGSLELHNKTWYAIENLRNDEAILTFNILRSDK